MFFAYEKLLTWIALHSALEGSAACGLGYIDYKTGNGNSDELILAMRKKRLAFAKFAFIMAILALTMVDKPSPNSVAPLVVGQIYTSLKIGTQIGFNLTPEKFFFSRTLLAMYNLFLLLAVWYKLRQGRREKIDLEFQFFVRVDAVMARMSNIFDDDEFKVMSAN
jgi:hypothetical protein